MRSLHNDFKKKKKCVQQQFFLNIAECALLQKQPLLQKSLSQKAIIAECVYYHRMCVLSQKQPLSQKMCFNRIVFVYCCFFLHSHVWLGTWTLSVLVKFRDCGSCWGLLLTCSDSTAKSFACLQNKNQKYTLIFTVLMYKFYFIQIPNSNWGSSSYVMLLLLNVCMLRQSVL